MVYEAIDYSTSINIAINNLDMTATVIDSTLEDISKLKNKYINEFSKYEVSFASYKDAIKKINKIGKVSSVFALIGKIVIGMSMVLLLLSAVICFFVPKEFLFRGQEKNVPSAWNSIGIKKICRMDLLQYSFFQHALWGSLLTAIACGLVGTYIVSRRLVFISGGITHASFGGLGLGFYLGMNPILMALVFSVLSAFGVEWISRSQDIREDSAIAGVWSLGMALGVIFIFLTPGYAPNLSAYLFGNILTISTTDLWGMGILALLLVALFGLFLREILYVAFDRNFALTQGMPFRLIEYAIMFCIAVTIVLAIRLVGIMLLMSLLTLPQITINLLTSDFKKIMLGSIALGFLGCIVGLFLSYYLNVPSGAFIILVLVLSFLIVKAIKAFQMR
jgi:zinc transport system permease protein